MREGLTVGASATISVPVTDALTVPAMPLPGLADFPAVFATGYLVAFAECAAVEVMRPYLEDGEGSVGIDVNFEHIAATPTGMTVTATATVTAIEGRMLGFDIELFDDAGPIGGGTHRRAVIDRAKFDARLAKKSAN